MYRVEDRRSGVTYLVYTIFDPRKAGCREQVDSDVTLDVSDDVNSWPDGADRPEVVVGRDPNEPTHDRVFRTRKELNAAGYRLVPGNFVAFSTWTEYLKAYQPMDLGEDGWYRQLDLYDTSGRQRRAESARIEPAGNSRDAVAEWVAQEHMLVDTSVSEVWYLPHAAPPQEIRLLELNDRFAGTELPVEPIDFGVDVGGASFHLFVADITSEQLDKIQASPSQLPHGWRLDGKRIWRRPA